MTQTVNRKEFAFDDLLHPAWKFRTPLDVVADSGRTVLEKRAILASWASDACTDEAAPDLRKPPAAPVVRFDDIMDAKRLDGDLAGDTSVPKVHQPRLALEGPPSQRQRPQPCFRLTEAAMRFSAFVIALVAAL
jgi:hypothetical protein